MKWKDFINVNNEINKHKKLYCKYKKLKKKIKNSKLLLKKSIEAKNESDMTIEKLENELKQYKSIFKKTFLGIEEKSGWNINKMHNDNALKNEIKNDINQTNKTCNENVFKIEMKNDINQTNKTCKNNIYNLVEKNVINQANKKSNNNIFNLIEEYDINQKYKICNNCHNPVPISEFNNLNNHTDKIYKRKKEFVVDDKITTIYAKLLKELEEDKKNLILQLNSLLNEKKIRGRYFFNDKNDLIEKYYYLVKIVKNMNEEKKELISKINFYKEINDRLKTNFYVNKTKKRKYFEMTFNEACEMKFEMVHGIQSKSNLQKIKELKEFIRNFVSEKEKFLLPYFNYTKYLNDKMYNLEMGLNKFSCKISNYIVKKNKKINNDKILFKIEFEKMFEEMNRKIEDKNEILKLFEIREKSQNDYTQKVVIENQEIKKEIEKTIFEKKEIEEKIKVFDELLDEIQKDMNDLENENNRLKEKIELKERIDNNKIR
ncbi:hypothetical protein GVAV_002318 [Gurleya vavrai]